ncbi:cytochrome c [Nisaea acidiphila]|uniref:Cytochrome c n=1 Tax=Nisaea acidiphila TaxID=1862145 RepID=A0A9J7AT55_9PROT|nr:cytochrome c [Nisaea acidiphila]UUX49516.1 cytochrome c [Nisaea acidiphila]
MTGPMRRISIGIVVLGLAAAVAAWFLSAPKQIGAADLPAGKGDPERGATLFAIGGCVSCHAPEGAKGTDKLVLAGGRAFKTEFGTFYAPNISPDPDAGIGRWEPVDFVNAMKYGTSPDGGHFYPAFPYTSYARMQVEDLLDLWAYLTVLPASDRANRPHDIGFPFSIRRAVGFWKLLYLAPEPVVPVGEDLERGRYLVEGPGHCGECHTPRSPIGGPDLARWLGGGPNPDGPGTIPNLTPGGETISGWSEADIAEYLKSGFTPDFDTAGGSMADVVENTSQLDDDDRLAIARYLKALPAVGAAE